MNSEEFRRHAHRMVDWMADFLAGIDQYPVRAQVQPGEIKSRLPLEAPVQGEAFEQIFEDFERKILDGITHWQHPAFHAYFPANGSYPSLLAEMLTATLGAQCMVWETSPAAAELEERVMDWLKALKGLPADWHGVIQDTASTATLCALLSAREKASAFAVNHWGLTHQRYTVYCSTETHSSVEKALKITGIGSAALRKVPVHPDTFGMDTDALRDMIMADIAAEYQPLCVVASLGTTGCTAMDPLDIIGDLCVQYGLWLHVDAAYAGTAALLPEYRHYFRGIEKADSYVFNPHKWMFTHFDCTAYFVRDKGQLIRTFEIMPEYLKTAQDQVVHNYRDWGIQLGRRFRALKLWFVLRSYGVEGMQAALREHMRIANVFEQALFAQEGWQRMAPVTLNLVCFRYCPAGMDDQTADVLNARLLRLLNDSGKVYLSHTRLHGRYTLRAVFGQTHVGEGHAIQLVQLLQERIATLTAGT